MDQIELDLILFVNRVKIDIIKHNKENNGKSTAIHCILLAPDQTSIYSQDDSRIPNYSRELDQINTVLVYPDKDAISIEEFVNKSKRPIQRLVFMDATWAGIPQLRRIEQLQKLTTVSLNAYKTEYWRPQKGYTDECLATIEAIFYTVKEFWQAENPDKEYDGRFDDLMFWFRYFKSKVTDTAEKRSKEPRKSDEVVEPGE